MHNEASPAATPYSLFGLMKDIKFPQQMKLPPWSRRLDNTAQAMGRQWAGGNGRWQASGPQPSQEGRLRAPICSHTLRHPADVHRPPGWPLQQ